MNAWWTAVRPQTLVASIGPVILATALASQYVQVNQMIFVVTLLCALSLQISVNLANDLFDGLSGVDNEHRLGPKRALQSGLLNAKELKVGLGAVLILSVVLGGILVTHGGTVFLFLGLASILAALVYSAGPFPLASNALGEAAVFVFFGLVCVLGTFYLQTFTITFKLFVYACIVGILNSALMLVNNIRDIDSDQIANKVTLAIKLGPQRAKLTYKLMLVSALTIHIAINYNNLLTLVFPLVICILLLPMLLVGINTYQGKEFNTLLVNTAKFVFVYCITTTIAALVSNL